MMDWNTVGVGSIPALFAVFLGCTPDPVTTLKLFQKINEWTNTTLNCCMQPCQADLLAFYRICKFMSLPKGFFFFFLHHFSHYFIHLVIYQILLLVVIHFYYKTTFSSITDIRSWSKYLMKIQQFILPANKPLWLVWSHSNYGFRMPLSVTHCSMWCSSPPIREAALRTRAFPSPLMKLELCLNTYLNLTRNIIVISTRVCVIKASAVHRIPMGECRLEPHTHTTTRIIALQKFGWSSLSKCLACQLRKPESRLMWVCETNLILTCSISLTLSHLLTPHIIGRHAINTRYASAFLAQQ